MSQFGHSGSLNQISTCLLRPTIQSDGSVGVQEEHQRLVTDDIVDLYTTATHADALVMSRHANSV